MNIQKRLRATGWVGMRYPAGDPENGPAYRQRWNGTAFECAGHVFITMSDVDDETGIEYSWTGCKYCGGIRS